MKSTKLSNYFIAIIASVIYAFTTYSYLPIYEGDYTNHLLLAFIISMMAPLFISAIISALISFTTKKKFSIIFVWVTVLLSFMSAMGQSYFVHRLMEREILENKIEEPPHDDNLLKEIDLRSELDDIMEQYENSRNEIDNLNVDLDEQESVIDSLKSEIRNLLNVEKDFKKAKKKIVALQNISKKYFEQVDSLLAETKLLVLENKNLKEENTLIKNKNENLNSETIELNARLDVGSILEVFEIEIDKLKYGSQGQERKVIWAKNIQFLRCCFKISANSIAKAESKSVYIQYISPSGKLLQSSNTPEEAIFVYEDSTIHTTTYSEFKYQNNEIELCVDWERGDPLERGKYKILFFIEGKLVAASSFKLG